MASDTKQAVTFNPVRRLRDAPLQVQASIMLVSVAIVSILLTSTLVSLTIRVVLDGAVSADVVARINLGVRIVSSLVGCGTLVACVGAAAYLRSTIVHALEPIGDAATSIASGEFDHRIRSVRTDDLGRLAHSIDAMAERLGELDRSRHEFIAAVSHELRTPLTVIRGHAFTLGRHEMDLRRQQGFNLIDSECERLASMISQLLDAASMQAGGCEVALANTNVASYMEHLVERLRAIVPVGASTLTMAVDPLIRDQSWVASIDQSRLNQVIDNLISNAVRHGAVGTSIELRATVQDVDRLRCEVINRGEAFPEDVLARLGEPFTRGRASIGGVGLGLSIVASILASHRSRLEVVHDNGYTRCWFEIEAHPHHETVRAPVEQIA